MNNPIKLIEKIWKTGMISLVVMTMALGGLFLNLKAASAAPNPNMTVRHLAVSSVNGTNWDHNVTLNDGEIVHFYSEIHNTVVGSRALAVNIKDTVTGGNFVDGTSVATASAQNANSASDTVNIHINNGGSLEFLPNTARVTWDVNGDGNFEYKNTSVAGNPMSAGGLTIGDQDGCNNFIIQVGWDAKVVGGPRPSPSPSPRPTPSPTPSPSPSPSVSPTPSPSPTPVVSPSPTPVVVNNNENNNSQSQDQTQNNNQTVNVSVAGTSTGTVGVPVKTPETGVSVLGLTSMFGAGPVGLFLSKFGRGKTVSKKREEESLSEIANGLFKNRSKRTA